MGKQNETKVPKTDYSKIARHYDKVRTKPGVLSSKIIKYGGIKPGNMVLDFGCGTGRFTNDLSALTECLLIGLEPSLEMLRKALLKDRSRSVAWTLGDGQQLPFANEIFDGVYMTFVLHHLERKELALQEIYRVLKKGGRCVIMTTSHSQIRRHVLNDFPGVTAIDLKRFPSVPSIKKSMTNMSFKNVHYHVFHRFESTPMHKYLERVKSKYASTLTLFNEKEFQRRFRVFKQKMQAKHGTHVKRISGFVFVVARK
jgi:ubiquinone/menaquinone biosynthesis C-methylase UbiE